LTKDVNRFVCVMDAISDGEFLRSKGPFVALKWNWEELPWLKAKGYYSLAAFIAYKLELSLRLSWLNSHAKKRMKNINSNTANNCYSLGNAHETAKNGVAPGLGVFTRQRVLEEERVRCLVERSGSVGRVAYVVRAGYVAGGCV
ncbi:hypothetical protein KI387_043263, partial [Taxus chinensis]